MDGDVYHRPARLDPAVASESEEEDDDEDFEDSHDRDHDDDDDDDDDDDRHHSTNERVSQLEEQLALAAEFGMSLTQRCEEADARAAQLERELQFVREEKQDVERDRTRARVELDDVAHHAEELQHQLGTAQQRLKSARSELDHARDEIEELRTTRRSRGHTRAGASSAAQAAGRRGGLSSSSGASSGERHSEPHGRSAGGLDASPRGLSGRRRASSDVSLDGIDQDALDALVNQHGLEKAELELQLREQSERTGQVTTRLEAVLTERGTLQKETENLRKELRELSQSSEARAEDLETTNSRLTVFVNETVMNVASLERKCAELEDLYAASNRRGDELQDQVQALSQQLAAPPTAAGGDDGDGSGAAAGAGGLATTPKGSSLANSTIIQSNRFFQMNLAPKAALSPSSKVLRDRKHKNKGVADLHDFFMLTGTAVRMNLMLHADTVELVGRVSWTPEISRDWHDKALAAGIPFHEFQHWIADQFLLEASISEDRKKRIQAVQLQQEEEENARRLARAQALRETPTPEVRVNGAGGGSRGGAVPGRITRRPRVTPISPPDPQSPANATQGSSGGATAASAGAARHPQEQMLRVAPQASPMGAMNGRHSSGGLADSVSPLSRGTEPLGGLSAADLDAMVSPSFGRAHSPGGSSTASARRKKKKPKSRVATIASSVSSFFS